jgi:isochorismate pyruvate lyase
MAHSEAEACTTLEEVRAGIDALDREVVALLARRSRFVARAAALKTDPDEASAPARVEQVIAKVRALAGSAGLEPAVAEAAYRALIASFIDLEREAIAARAKAAG